jgi:hypothetical protein
MNEFRELRGEVGGDDLVVGDHWVSIADALAGGDYETLINLLIEQNKHVMLKRGGAPWIEKRYGKLHVHFAEEKGPLPQRDELASMWRFPYFLDSLRSVAAALREN